MKWKVTRSSPPVPLDALALLGQLKRVQFLAVTLPNWIRPLGLVEHVIVGAVVTALLAALGTPAAARVVAVAAVGIAHEWGDGDFTRSPGAPWNGVLDVVAFLPAPVLWWLL